MSARRTRKPRTSARSIGASIIVDRLFGIDKLVDSIVANYEAEFRSGWEEPTDRFGVTSPIEKLFLLGLMPRIMYSPYTRFLRQSFRFNDPWPEKLRDGAIHLFTQCKIIGTWPVDFVVAIRLGEAEIKIVIECDGHDFHERTKEQAARDRSRDRELQRLGFKIMRFTGAEIWRDPWACVGEVEADVRAWLDERREEGEPS